jgi:XapX domain-containing protein
MRMYIVALFTGIAVGVFYGSLGVRSPAPPVVALVGLFGILIGEQVIPVGKNLLAGQSLPAAWMRAHSHPHVFGMLPGRHSQAKQNLTTPTEEQP